jgi:hypothetical protein
MRYEYVPKVAVWAQDSAALATGSRANAIRNAWGPKGAAAAASNPPGVRPDLATIDAHIKSYAATYSPMAKINVLNEPETLQ